MDDNVKYISGRPVEPQKYNIILTRDGDEIDFAFPPAQADLITRYGYLKPFDDRAESGLVHEEKDLYKLLQPIIGKGYNGDMAYHTRKQVIIALHDTAILGYQRQVIIDPRISNEVANFWEIYLDQRIFPQAEQADWQMLMGEIIAVELENRNADERLAQDIKNQLLQQAREDAEASFEEDAEMFAPKDI